MKLVLVLYVNGIRTGKEVDFNSSSAYEDYEIDPRPEWSNQNGASQDQNDLLKLSIEDIPHEWKIETRSERGDPLAEGWVWND